MKMQRAVFAALPFATTAAIALLLFSDHRSCESPLHEVTSLGGLTSIFLGIVGGIATAFILMRAQFHTSHGSPLAPAIALGPIAASIHLAFEISSGRASQADCTGNDAQELLLVVALQSTMLAQLCALSLTSLARSEAPSGRRMPRAVEVLALTPIVIMAAVSFFLSFPSARWTVLFLPCTLLTVIRANTVLRSGESIKAKELAAAAVVLCAFSYLLSWVHTAALIADYGVLPAAWAELPLRDWGQIARQVALVAGAAAATILSSATHWASMPLLIQQGRRPAVVAVVVLCMALIPVALADRP